MVVFCSDYFCLLFIACLTLMLFNIWLLYLLVAWLLTCFHGDLVCLQVFVGLLVFVLGGSGCWSCCIMFCFVVVGAQIVLLLYFDGFTNNCLFWLFG